MRTWKIVLGIALMGLPAALPAQWAIYGNRGVPHSLIRAAGGGWIVATDGNVFKLSTAGQGVWGQRFDMGSPRAFCRKAWSTPDGGCVGAVDDSFGGVATLFKLSASGSVAWQRTYSLTDAQIGVFCPMSDGGVIMAGRLDLDLLVCRCSPDGEIAWSWSYGSDRLEEATAATATSDGGTLILGSSRFVDSLDGSPGEADLWALKLASTGQVVWQRRIGGGEDDVGECVLQTPDGGFLIAGPTASFDAEGLSRLWLLKLDEAGEVLRQLTFDHPYGGDGWIQIRPAAGGTYQAAIRPAAPAPGHAVFMIIGPDGAVLRERSYEVVYTQFEVAVPLPTPDGGCLLSLSGPASGYDPRDQAVVMKLGPTGDVEWRRSYGSEFSNDRLSLLDDVDGGGYLLAGSTDSWGGLSGATWILRVAADGSIGPRHFYIREVNAPSPEDLQTWREEAATVSVTEAISQSAGLIAEPAAMPFNSSGPTEFPALGSSLSTLTIRAGTGGTTEPAPGGYLHVTGSSIHMSAASDSNYGFSGWSGNVDTKNKGITIVLDGDKNVSANFYLAWDWGEFEELRKALGCFVATAAYGDPSHPDVEVLRRFRDRYLMKSRAGRAFVKLYYKYSPPLAEFVAERPALRAVSRAILSPVVAACRFLLGL